MSRVPVSAAVPSRRTSAECQVSWPGIGTVTVTSAPVDAPDGPKAAATASASAAVGISTWICSGAAATVEPNP